MAHLEGKPGKPKANRRRIEHLVKAAQYEDLARTVSDRDAATAYRAKARHERSVAEVLPEFDTPGATPLAVERLLNKAASYEELASHMSGEGSLGYFELAAKTRRFADEIRDGR